MGWFNRYKPNDALYLTPVQMGNEQLPADKVRMLYCDAKGNLGTTIVENSVYELAKGCVEELASANYNYAALSLEIAPGTYVPTPVVISPEQVWALEQILEHALKRGEIPEILKKYPKEIIKMGEAKRQELEIQHEPASYYTIPALTRLADYIEDNMEVAVPIYKSQHRYPLVILKRLLPNASARPNMQRLLTLDSDGDLVIIRVPVEIIDKAERAFKAWKRINKSEGCIIYSRHPDGFAMSHLAISKFQRKALDIIAQNFEETGYGQHPISADAQAVLAQARAKVDAMGYYRTD